MEIGSEESSSGGWNKESANPRPPQVSGLGTTVPLGNRVEAPAHATSSSLVGSNTALQSPDESVSSTHGENTTGSTMPTRRTELEF